MVKSRNKIVGTISIDRKKLGFIYGYEFEIDTDYAKEGGDIRNARLLIHPAAEDTFANIKADGQEKQDVTIEIFPREKRSPGVTFTISAYLLTKTQVARNDFFEINVVTTLSKKEALEEEWKTLREAIESNSAMMKAIDNEIQALVERLDPNAKA